MPLFDSEGARFQRQRGHAACWRREGRMKPIRRLIRSDEVPDTVAFTGHELDDLLVASIEQTIALDTTPKRRVRTLRTQPPPPQPQISTAKYAQSSIAPITYTPPSGIARARTRRPITLRVPVARSIAFGAL